jgi:hypothetical protein
MKVAACSLCVEESNSPITDIMSVDENAAQLLAARWLQYLLQFRAAALRNHLVQTPRELIFKKNNLEEVWLSKSCLAV